MNMSVSMKSLPIPQTVPADDIQCVLDLVHLSRMTLGDRNLETELLELFDRQATTVMARLSGPSGAHGQTGADIAHMLCGSARAIGAFGVAAAAADTEAAMRAGISAESALAGLAQAVADARRTVASLLS